MQPRANYALSVLLAAYILSFIDRNVMAILIGPIRQSFEISDFQFGLLHGLAFTIFYTFLGLPIGRLADRWSRRTIIGIGVFFWSLMTMACGLVSSFVGLFIARMGVGVGEAALSPPAHSLLTDFFEPERLPGAMSVFTLGITIGGGLAYMVGGWVYGMFEGVASVWPVIGQLETWQLTFIAVGAPGLVVALMMVTVPEPVRSGRSGHWGDAVPVSEVIDWLRTNRRIYGAYFVSISLLAVMGYGMMSWYVEMIIRRFGADRTVIGPQFGWLFVVFGSVGALAGGWFTGWLERRGYPDAHLRIVMLAAMAWVLPAVAGPLLPTEGLVLWAAAPGLFLLNSYFGAAIAGLQLATPNAMRAQVSALLLFMTNVLGLGVGPALVGFLTDYVFGADNFLHYSLSALGAALCPVAAVAAGVGLKAARAFAARQVGSAGSIPAS